MIFLIKNIGAFPSPLNREANYFASDIGGSGVKYNRRKKPTP
jgi:hypothetical protein